MNRPYVVYNSTGVILRTGRATNVEIQAGPGEFVIEGTATDLDHRVDPESGTIILAPEIRTAHNARAAAATQFAFLKRTATASRLNAILANPTTDSDIKLLAELELERL